MRRNYELTLVFRIFGTDDEQKQALDQTIAWIEEDGNGKVITIDRSTLGRRKLAYPIDKQREALYLIVYAEIETQHLPELELNFKLSTSILRYLLIRIDELPKTKTPEPSAETAVEKEVADEDSKTTDESVEEAEAADTDDETAADQETEEEEVEETSDETITESQNELDASNLKGVGPVAIQHFNEQGWFTYQDLVDAGIEAIAEIPGISEAGAKLIHNDATAIINAKSESEAPIN